MVELVYKTVCESGSWCYEIDDRAYVLYGSRYVGEVRIYSTRKRRGVYKYKERIGDRLYDVELVVNDPKYRVYDRVLRLPPDMPVLFVVRFKCKYNCKPDSVVYGNARLQKVEDPKLGITNVWVVGDKWRVLLGFWYGPDYYDYQGTRELIPNV